MQTPALHVFAISHYCEKARWALDYFGLDYQLRYTMPGMNRKIAKKLGSNAGSLPFLQIDNSIVAGSSSIIDWGESNRAPEKPSLSGDLPDVARGMEKRLDDVIGVHIRRYYYSDALFTNPAAVRPIFSRDLPLFPKIAVTLGWSKIVPLMIKGMDLGPDQGLQSRAIVTAELDWLDGLLSDGRPYLSGDSFSRADLTAASLLAPLVNPPQHPTSAGVAIPPAVEAMIRQWRDRPVMQWVSRMYTEHR
jgi:glutathione S-transferase